MTDKYRERLHPMPIKERLAELLAEGITAQTETDNLGDCESLVLMANTPVINVVQLAEFILAALKWGVK